MYPSLRRDLNPTPLPRRLPQVPIAECMPAAARALEFVDMGSKVDYIVKACGWERLPRHQLLELGLGRSWRVTGLALKVRIVSRA